MAEAVAAVLVVGGGYVRISVGKMFDSWPKIIWTNQGSRLRGSG